MHLDPSLLVAQVVYHFQAMLASQVANPFYLELPLDNFSGHVCSYTQ